MEKVAKGDGVSLHTLPIWLEDTDVQRCVF